MYREHRRLRRVLADLGIYSDDGGYVRSCEVPAGLGLAARYPFRPSYADNGDGVRVASLGWSPFDQPAYAACRAGPQIFVSLTGNDTTGTGSVNAPYLTFDKAINVLNTGGVAGTIIGINNASTDEHRRNLGGQFTVKPTVDVVFLSRAGIWRGGVYDSLTYSQNTTTFPALTGNPNVYACPRGLAAAAWNPQLFDVGGQPLRYTPITAASEAAGAAIVNRIPGSFYTNGTNIYISTFDGSAPSDANVRVNLAINCVNWTSFNSAVNVYFDGETEADGWSFDGSAQIAASAVAPSLFTIAMRRVSFSRPLSAAANCFAFDGINGLVWLEQCAGVSAFADIFNFHNNVNADMTVVVLNSSATDAGRGAGSFSNNSFTGHESIKMISAGNRFTNSAGGNMRNIGQTKTLSVGDYISGDKGDQFNTGGLMPPTEVRTDDTAQIWLFDPIIRSSRANDYAMYATSNSKIMVRGAGAIRGMTGGAGVIGKW
jgi:hypothetical protein